MAFKGMQIVLGQNTIRKVDVEMFLTCPNMVIIFSIIFPVNGPAFVSHIHDRYIVLTL